jgi:hypothetical protein
VGREEKEDFYVASTGEMRQYHEWHKTSTESLKMNLGSMKRGILSYFIHI